MPTSSDIAIKLVDLGKQYRIGAPQERYRTLREAIVQGAGAPVRRVRQLLKGGAAVDRSTETIWALDRISLEVAAGEVVGVIGRNGAGKSTLLKVLSRITEPTIGHAEILGRVGSLLEVGTGFHPELTGRENIFLNGAILGMGRAEIDRKMDEIVAFAEVERFLDTPVKHFSSGMYLRLAFAVAAHLDTEVLLVDEVLAVGDAAFQRKCLGKMSGVAKEGRTVLFVSHNMAAVEALCDRTIVLEEGRVAYDGEASSAIQEYFSRLGEPLEGASSAAGDNEGSHRVLLKVLVRDEEGQPSKTFPVGARLTLEFHLDLPHPVQDLQVGVGLKNEFGARLFTLAPRWSSTPLGPSEAGPVTVSCQLQPLLLMPGRYMLRVVIGDRKADFAILDDIASFEIIPRDIWGTGALPRPYSQGVIMADAQWSMVRGDTDGSKETILENG